MSEPNLRQAVRGLMIDPADRVLLVKIDLPWTDWAGWILPGGGIEEGEDHRAALTRELIEETGVPDVFMGPPLWDRTHIGASVANGFDGQHEVVYLVPCHTFEIAPALSAEELLAEAVVGARWWTLEELEATGESVKPEQLPAMLRQVLDTGAPEEPLVILEQS